MKIYCLFITLLSVSAHAVVDVESLDITGKSATLFQKDGIIYKRECPIEDKSCSKPEEMKIGSKDQLVNILYSQAEKILAPSTNYLMDEAFNKKILAPLSEQERKMLRDSESFLVQGIDEYKKKTDIDPISQKNLDGLSKKLSMVQGKLSSDQDIKKNQEEVKQVIIKIIDKITDPNAISLPENTQFEYVLTSGMVDFVSTHSFKVLNGQSNCSFEKDTFMGKEFLNIMNGTKYLVNCFNDGGNNCEYELSKLYKNNLCKDLASPDTIVVKDEAQINNNERAHGKEVVTTPFSGDAVAPASKQQ